jgi:2,4-dienoyl-CoA reductase-like NADH-dependent reductase (Old Yellow Enzyme family)
MVPWRATSEGEVTPAVLDWYGRFADGRPGVLVVEATGIRDVPSGPLLRIGHERYLPGLKQLVEVVKERSQGQTRLLIQIIDFLAIKRRPEKEKFLRQFLEITPALRTRLAQGLGLSAEALGPDAALREQLLLWPEARLCELLDERQLEALEMGYRERVTDMHLEHIRRLPEVLPGLFAAAAERAQQAGFDGVELHCAHAYTLASFLSARNTRPDGYGGERCQRLRLPLEVYRAVRQRVGANWCVGARFLGDEVIAGGSGPSDAAFFGAEFARAGMDFLSVSKGGKFEDAEQPKVGAAAYPYTGPSGHECMPTVRIGGAGPFGRNLPLAAEVRRAVRALHLETPVVGAGGIADFDMAENALARGDCDLVAAARQSLADPDWWLKLEQGRGATVRRCKFTNYCEALDQRHVEVTCQLWDRDFTTPEANGGPVQRSADGKRRLNAPRS